MRRIITAWLSATALTLASLPVALAADMPVKAYNTTVFDWTGLYVGASVGGGWGNRSVGYSSNDAASTALFAPGGLAPGVSGAPPHTSFNSSGALGGLQLGYNWQLNRTWLVGLETDFNFSDIKGSGSSTPSLLAPFLNASADEKVTWFGTVRARLGYLPTERLLTYVTGGLAYGRVEHNASYSSSNAFAFGANAANGSFTCNIASNCFAGATSRIAAGWTLGGGFEYALLNNVSLKAEYMYVSLAGESVTETALVPNVPGFPLSTFNADYNRTSFNVARVGLNYRF